LLALECAALPAFFGAATQPGASKLAHYRAKFN
jgi:hypothetical protein